MTGYGGWCWISKTRVQRFVPKLPGNTNVNYRKELEGTFKTFFFFNCINIISCCCHVWLMLCIFPDVLEAKMNKANTTATCTNEQKILKPEPQPAQNTAEDGKQMVIGKTSQREPSIEDCKHQNLKEEGKLLEGLMEAPEEMKKENEKMENEPCPEATASNAEKGKYNSLIIFLALSFKLTEHFKL